MRLLPRCRLQARDVSDYAGRSAALARHYVAFFQWDGEQLEWHRFVAIEKLDCRWRKNRSQRSRDRVQERARRLHATAH